MVPVKTKKRKGVDSFYHVTSGSLIIRGLVPLFRIEIRADRSKACWLNPLLDIGLSERLTFRRVQRGLLPSRKKAIEGVLCGNSITILYEKKNR